MRSPRSVLALGALLAAGALAGCSDNDTYIVFNTPPVVSIVDPPDDTVYDQGDTVTIRGLVADDGGVDNLELQWSSSIDQELYNEDVPDQGGNVELVTASLSVGSHVITLRAFDQEAQAGEGRVTIHIEGVPDFPFIELHHPTTNEDGLEDSPFHFEVFVSDHQDQPQDLIIAGESDVDGPFCTMQADSTGIATCDAVLSLGQHLLTFTVTDRDSFTATATAIFHVVSLLDYDADHDGFTPNQGDCDDANNTMYPGAPELCDLRDNDCNPSTPVDVGTACYDDDGDNYCEAPPCRNASGTGSDCDDANQTIHPGAAELPDGVDNDCNGDIDDGTTRFDDDGDGYCETPPCVNVPGSTQSSPRDCNDDDYLVNPGMTEVCGDGKDNDCNGTQNDQNAIGCHQFWFDADGDLHGRMNNPQAQCWCDSGFAPYTGTIPDDCQDANPSVHPGQTQYFGSSYTATNGTPSFDYNCSGGPEPYYTGLATCASAGFLDCSGSDGFVGSVPACGQSREWRSGCGFDTFGFVVGCVGVCTLSCAVGTCSACTSCVNSYCYYDGTTSKQQVCR